MRAVFAANTLFTNLDVNMYVIIDRHTILPKPIRVLHF